MKDLKKKLILMYLKRNYLAGMLSNFEADCLKLSIKELKQKYPTNSLESLAESVFFANKAFAEYIVCELIGDITQTPNLDPP